MFTVPPRSHYVCRWEIAVFSTDDGRLTYQSQQELPGALVYHQHFHADGTEPDELAAFYDDSCRDINMCENLFALVLEDVSKVRSQLL